MALVETISQYWLKIQRSLFPWIEEELGELTEKDQELVTALELIRIERFTGVQDRGAAKSELALS